jgi:hypothetical protein
VPLAALSQAPVTWTSTMAAAHTSSAETRPPYRAACSATSPQIPAQPAIRHPFAARPPLQQEGGVSA